MTLAATFFFCLCCKKYYSFIKDIVRDPCQWSLQLGESEGQLRSAKKNEMDFTVWLSCQQVSPLLSLISWCRFLRITQRVPSMTHLHKYINIHIRHNIYFARGSQQLPDSKIHKQCLTFWIINNLQTSAGYLPSGCEVNKPQTDCSICISYPE